MKFTILKLTVLLLAMSMIMTSCSDDSTTSITDDATEEALLRGGRGGNGNGGGGNGGGNGGNGGGDNDNLARIDESLATDWIDLFLELDRYAFGMRPNATARALAYINLAAYETGVPGMRNNNSLENVYGELDIDQSQIPRNLDYAIALNATYAYVLDHFLINLEDQYRQQIVDLESEKLQDLERGLSNNTIENSHAWGSYVASQIIAFSQTDNEAEAQILEPQPTSYVPPTGDGFWTYSADPERALFPYWGSVRTFVIAPEETSTVEPIPYSSQPGTAYYDEMLEVYEVNNQAKADQGEQLWIAEFWSDDVEGLMMSPPGRQFAIASQLVDQYDLNLEETLEMFVKLGFSLNDAAVATWKYKYQYMVMRPSNYIHEFIDPDFQTNLFRLVYWPNPSFPGYPSGHSTFASAAGGVFIDYFGDQTNFTDRTHEGRTEFLGEPRTFDTFSDMAAENAFSRIPLGVHIRIDCSEGLRLGYEIADAINDFDLDPEIQ